MEAKDTPTVEDFLALPPRSRFLTAAIALLEACNPDMRFDSKWIGWRLRDSSWFHHQAKHGILQGCGRDMHAWTVRHAKKAAMLLQHSANGYMVGREGLRPLAGAVRQAERNPLQRCCSCSAKAVTAPDGVALFSCGLSALASIDGWIVVLPCQDEGGSKFETGATVRVIDSHDRIPGHHLIPSRQKPALGEVAQQAGQTVLVRLSDGEIRPLSGCFLIRTGEADDSDLSAHQRHVVERLRDGSVVPTRQDGKIQLLAQEDDRRGSLRCPPATVAALVRTGFLE